MEKKSENFQYKFLMGISICSGFLLLSLGFYANSDKLIDLAELLPEEHTRAFLISKKSVLDEDFLFMGENLENLPWIKDDIATAWLDQGEIKFFELSSRLGAMEFLENKKMENEEWEFRNKDEDEEIKCFSISRPECFAFHGAFLVISDRSEVLELFFSDKGRILADDVNYINARQRLPYGADAVFYLHGEKTLRFLSSFGLDIPVLAGAFLMEFASFAFGLEVKSDHIYGESHGAFHRAAPVQGFSPAYKAELLRYARPNFAFEFGGLGAAVKFTSWLENLENADASAALFWRATLGEFWKEWSGEYYLGFTDEENWLFLLDLGEGKAPAPNVIFKDAVELESIDFEGDYYSQWQLKKGGQIYASALSNEVSNVFILSSQKDDLRFAMDVLRAREASLRPDFDWAGMDEFFAINMTFLEEVNILKKEMPKVDKIEGGLKVFDDGIFSRFRIR